MARKPKTPHARALHAFMSGLITKREYQDCALGRSAILGRTLFEAGFVNYKPAWRKIFLGEKVRDYRFDRSKWTTNLRWMPPILNELKRIKAR